MQRPRRFNWHRAIRDAKLIIIEIGALVGLVILLCKAILREFRW